MRRGSGFTCARGRSGNCEVVWCESWGLMSKGMTRPGLSEDFLKSPGGLIPGGTGGVGGDALESRNSLPPNGGKDVSGDVSAAPPVRVGCEALDIGNRGRGFGAEDVEHVGRHFEVEVRSGEIRPSDGGLEWRGA